MSSWQFALLFVAPIVIGMLWHRARYRKLLRRRMAEHLHAHFQQEATQQLLGRLSGESSNDDAPTDKGR